MTRHLVGTYKQLFPQQHIPVILLLILQVGKNICKKTSTDFEVYFAIEAKRLRVTFPSRFFSGGTEYVKDGMMRFITG